MEKAHEKIRNEISHEIQALLEGAAEDVAEFGAKISLGLTEAAALGDQALVDERLNQVEALAEVQRIRVNHAGWRLFRRALSIGIQAALAALPDSGDSQ